MKRKRSKKSFPMGRVVITSHALGRLHPRDVHNALRRHARRDWGNVSPDDWAANDRALKKGFRLLSSYCDRNKRTFWIITEADRASTTLLLPEDY
jgi:hypothetical protein